MIVIADSGSTKTDWRILTVEGKLVYSQKTEGLNPYFLTEEQIREVVAYYLHPYAQDITHVYFYGAGCGMVQKAEQVHRAIAQVMRPDAHIEVAGDMLGAARSTLQQQEGVACILGTGANSCVYRLGNIADNVPSLGYMLADWGSGAVLGREVLGLVLRQELPVPVIEDFYDAYRLTRVEILDRIYNQGQPNRFLASFSPFLKKHIDQPACLALVIDNFRRFFDYYVLQYRQLGSWPVATFVGSVAYHFREQLEQVAAEKQVRIGRIVQTPMEGLIAYHLRQHASDLSAMSAEKEKAPLPIGAATEASSHYQHLDKMSTRELLEGINREDARVHQAVALAIPQIEELVEQLLPRMRAGGRLFYIGAGTSGRLGILDASEIPPTYGADPGLVVGMIAGGDRAIRKAVENAEDDFEQAWKDLQAHNINDMDTLVGIAASGRTPYVIGGLRQANANGVLTACIVCNQGSAVAQEAKIPIEVVVGPEFVTGSTRMKSGTAQKLVLNMISTTAMIRLGHVKGNKMVDMQLSNEKLVDRGTRMIMDETGIGYEEAKQRLLQYGSVRSAIDTHVKDCGHAG